LSGLLFDTPTFYFLLISSDFPSLLLGAAEQSSFFLVGFGGVGGVFGATAAKKTIRRAPVSAGESSFFFFLFNFPVKLLDPNFPFLFAVNEAGVSPSNSPLLQPFLRPSPR